MTNRERARAAFDGADLAHDLERSLLAVGESLQRGQAPNSVTLANISSLLTRLGLLTELMTEHAADVTTEQLSTPL